jgi:predicted GH43/DUF377 family glycosyl hydrolase
VLQDKDWHLIDPSLNYSDYTYQYLETSVLKAGAGYVMYIRIDTNSTAAIYRGTSTNGADWTISPTPVLRTGPSGSWDASTVFSPSVVWNGTGYMMYYVGDGGTTANFRQIGVAFSSDGINWTKYAGNPVITHGPGWYDARYTRGPSVIYDGGTYKMWYYATAQINYSIPLEASIDLATSPDGVHWTKYPNNPVFYGFRYSNNTTSSDYPSVVKVNGTYLMAFSGYGADIGYATSADGIGWSFDNQTSLLLATSGWHTGFIDEPSILVDGGRVLLWYDGYDSSNHTSPYMAGVGFASCGVLVATPPVTVTSVSTSTATSYVTTASIVTSTSISTSIIHSTQTLTQILNPNAPLFEVATAGVVGFAAAIAVAVVLIATRLRSKRPS